MSHAIDLSIVEKEYFEPFVNQQFDLSISDTQTISVTLVQVKGTGIRLSKVTGWDRQEEELGKEQFALVFRGDLESPLSQGMYRLHNDSAGTIDHLFLVPIAQDQAGLYYEASFA